MSKKSYYAFSISFFLMGLFVFIFENQINTKINGPFLYSDIRYKFNNRNDFVTLPAMGSGEFGVWIEFQDPLPDLSGITWEVNTIDTISHINAYVNNYSFSEYHSGSGTSGVLIGKIRVLEERQYQQKVSCKGVRSDLIKNRQPDIRIMATPGIRKINGIKYSIGKILMISFAIAFFSGGCLLWRLAKKS